MSRTQSRLTFALLFSALALLAFFGTAFISGAIDFMYRDAAGLSGIRNAAQLIAMLAAVVLVIAGFIVAIPVALQPGSWPRKILYVIPVCLLLFTLAGIASALFGIGAVGTLVNIPGFGSFTFASAWVAVGAILSTIAVVVAAARMTASPEVLRPAVITTGIADAGIVVATVAMIISVGIVASSQPSSFGGPGGGFPAGGQGQNRGGDADDAAGQNPGANNLNPASTEQASADTNNGQPAGNNQPGGQPPVATDEASSGQQPNGQNGQPAGQNGQPNGQNGQPNGQPGGNFPDGQNGGGGFPGGGQPPEGGFPGGGGPGGGTANLARNYGIGGIAMAVFAILALAAEASAARSLSTLPVTDDSLPAGTGREAGRAVISAVILGVIVLVVIQLVPVTRDNPPVQTPITWDSEQTKTLAYNACMDCHSNETDYPWYSYIAPSSWLTTIHVQDGREQMNLSELDSMPDFQKQMLANNMANQIRSGSMPPADYQILHPEARLTDEQKQQLIDGLQKSLSGL